MALLGELIFVEIFFQFQLKIRLPWHKKSDIVVSVKLTRGWQRNKCFEPLGFIVPVLVATNTNFETSFAMYQETNGLNFSGMPKLACA